MDKYGGREMKLTEKAKKVSSGFRRHFIVCRAFGGNLVPAKAGSCAGGTV